MEEDRVPDTRRQSDDRLRLTRLARGLSQGDLARAARVTRQAISGIESGRWSPSLDVALAVALALESSVEQLFGAPAESAPVRSRLAVENGSGNTQPLRCMGGERLLLAEVAGNTVAFPLSSDRAVVPGFAPALATAMPSNDAESGEFEGRRLRLRSKMLEARRMTAPLPMLAVAGCDPALALLQGPLQRHDPPVGLLWWSCGNAGALELLEAGTVHAAALHRATGSRARQRAGIEVVGFASWREGLAVSGRHRGQIGDLQDVARADLRIANREVGSEARRLLDDELSRLEIDPVDLAGYETECTAHLFVASAIASGLVDVGVTTEPAALAYSLDFIPWQQELSELSIPRSLLGSLEVRALLDVLAGRELPAQLAALDGYDAEPCGRILAA
jgi:putative molybdopterin biosynthesis protein